MMWAEKHRPKRLEEMVGNDRARATVFDWLNNWKRGMKPLLLVGPPGVGKTTTVYAAAAQLGYTVIEMNASDYRTEKQLTGTFRSAHSASLLQERRLLFLDEVDGLLGRSDYGGADFLADNIENIPDPVMMAANDPTSDQVKKLAKHARLVQLGRVPARLVEVYLREVIKKEGVSVPAELLREAVGASEGDMRAAMNGAQMAALGGVPSRGDRRMPLQEAVTAAAAADDFDQAVRCMQDAEGNADEKVRACFNSVATSSLDPERKRSSLRLLAEANLLIRRMRRTQQWRQLRYLNRLLAGALAGTRVPYSDGNLPWPLRQRLWNDSRHIKLFSSAMARSTGASSSDMALMHLAPSLMIISRAAGGIEGWCATRGMAPATVGALQRELKSVIARVGR